MRLFFIALALVSCLLFSVPCALSIPTEASASDPLIPSLPFQLSQRVTRGSRNKSWFTRFRDNVIQTIWRIPPPGASINAHSGDLSSTSSPPQSFLSRYGRDLVLRFNITSIEEAGALAEAINVLFLDVWEYTPQWVDIRLSKDVVSDTGSRLHRQVLIDIFTGAFTSWSITSISTARTHSVDA